MKWLMDILKGFAIGLANVVAGLSGGTIAVITNAYEDLIDFFSNIATHLLKALKKHYKLLIGIALGIVLGAATLKKLYTAIPLPVTGFFAGLVFISLLPLLKGLSFKEGKAKNSINIVLLILCAILLVVLALASSGDEKELALDAKNIFIMMGLGVLAALAMILPGVSGSMILLVLGYYTPVLGLVSITALKNNFTTTFFLLASFAVGALIGLILGSKVIKKLLAKYTITMNFIIYGLIVGSLIGMIITGIKANNALILDKGWTFGGKEDILMHISAIVLFIVGVLCGYLMDYFFSKKTKEKENLGLEDVNKEE